MNSEGGGCSEPRSRHCSQPGQQSETLSQKKVKIKINLGLAQWLTPVIPALWDAKVSRSLEARSLRPAWPTWRNPVSTKNTKISWVSWRTFVIQATQETEAQESLEPGRQRLQRAETTPLHTYPPRQQCETPSKKNTKHKKQNKTLPGIGGGHL